MPMTMPRAPWPSSGGRKNRPTTSGLGVTEVLEEGTDGDRPKVEEHAAAGAARQTART